MRNKRFSYSVVVLLFGLILMACSKVPDHLLQEKEMQAVMKDMLIAESMVNLDYNTYQDDAAKMALYESVFRKHGITQAVYDSSLIWYGKNLDIYVSVCERVLKDLEKESNELGDVQADAAPVSTNDSVNVWPRRSLQIFSSKVLYNGVNFDIKPDMPYSSGSIFVLGLDAWGLNRQLSSSPQIRICADQGDTTIVVNEKILRDGPVEVELKTIPTKKVNRVYGFIRMDSSDKDAFYKIFMDHIRLIRYNYGSNAQKPTEMVAPDR